MPDNNNEDGGLFDCRPILCVENVTQSIAYYVDTLGFRLGWAWADAEQRFLRHRETAEPTFAPVVRGKVQFMLSQKSQGAAGMWLYLDVHSAEQVDALHVKWSSNGARILEQPFVRPWGMYEMRVQDLDGHTLRISSPPREENSKS